MKKLLLAIGLFMTCIFFSLFFSLAFSFLFRGGSNTSNQQSSQVVSSQDEAVQQAAESVSKSVVSVLTTESSASGNLQGAGTGVIIRSSGLILTNKHVVPEGVSDISVVTSDGKKLAAKVVDRDSLNDLAFIKVDGGSNNLPAATLGDSSKLKPGQTVIAIGNALGQFQNTVTSGIVSGVGRPIEAADSSGGSSEALYNLIQTDTAINPGNSGGPLVNISGEVIGINVAASTDAENIGFAIPINDAKPSIDQVVNNGKITTAYLGVNFIPVTQEVAGYINSTATHGAYIYSDGRSPAVASGSPADKAGIKSGDIILKVNNQDIDEANPLSSVIAKFKPGDIVDVSILRGQDQISLKVTLGER